MRDCKHGRLARSCEICELESEVRSAEKLREAARAVVNLWHDFDEPRFHDAINALEDALSETHVPTVLGDPHFSEDEIDKEASQIALSENYNPNDVDPSEWTPIRDRYREKAIMSLEQKRGWRH